MSMTIDEALKFADEWSRGVTIYPGARGWRVACMLLADEVRRLREERNPLAERVTELEQQLAAKDDEIRELVTSDNKVIVDLSKYVETLEQKIAAKDARYRNLLRWFDRDDEPELGEYVYTAEIRSREDSIEKAIDKELRK